MQYKGISISKGNAKLGDKILNISLPPIKSCAIGVPCALCCYAVKCTRTRPTARKAWQQNLDLYEKNPFAYFGAILMAIMEFKPKRFRWHVAGDIPDTAYLDHMIRIARLCPSVKFLCFTKRHGFVTLIPPPSNFNFVLSYWNDWGNPALTPSFASAWYRDPAKPDPRIPKNAKHCSGSCETCSLCWNMKPGQSVVFDKH